MKYFKYFLFVFLGLIALFLLAGIIHPSINYGHEIEVDKSIEEAWAVHKDDTKFGLWLDGFKSIDLIEGEQDAVGSKYKVVVNPGEGQPDFEMIETVVSKEEFDHVTMSFDSDMMVFDQTTYFSEADGKTKVRTESSVKGKSLMMRSMFALMEILGGSFQKQETKNIEALKKVIESNSIDYYPVEEPEAGE